jgi:hypothetical protein
MGRRKKKNDIGDINKVRQFLSDAYGLSTQIVNEYHMKVRHDDHDGWYDWYHTTGTVVATSRGIDGEYHSKSFAHCLEEEDLAVKINQHIYEKS